MKKNSYKPLYMAWGFLYVLTAVLGLLFPEAEGTTVRLVLLLIAVMFFLPPALILERAKKAGDRLHIWLIRWLCLADRKSVV